jgi:NO-binding membrane sensor protein with MHYT domain/two-component sensor histidine kinase
VVGSYNGWLVVLSVVVAVIASFVALSLASRVTAARTPAAARAWLIGGAISIGAGIWSMHFIGMLAFRLPIRVSYDLALTGLSLLLPIVVSGLGLFEASRKSLGKSRLIVGGVLVGLGIVTMHYTGIAAMKMEPPIRYQPLLVGLSMLVAVAGSAISIWSSFRLRMATFFDALMKKAGSALASGSAIVGMHYTAMAAADFAPDSVCTATALNISAWELAAVVAGIALTFQVLTLAIAAYDAYRAERIEHERVGLEAQVAQRTAELGRMNRRLVETQEVERRQLARELHDRVGQNLTALGINLDILRSRGKDREDAEVLARLDDSIALVDSTADAIDDVMAELRPPMLDDHGLFAALQWLANQVLRRTGIDVLVRGDDPAPRLAPEAEIALFRIAQEALNNIAKHARATRIMIELHVAGTECVLSVSDDGAGFDPQALLQRGHGLTMMRERAQSVGGHLEVRAAPGKGTEILIRMHLQT